MLAVCISSQPNSAVFMNAIVRHDRLQDWYEQTRNAARPARTVREEIGEPAGSPQDRQTNAITDVLVPCK
jgi:hypothetical protein